MLIKFQIRYMAIVLESRDWRSPGIRDQESAWRSPSHILRNKINGNHRRVKSPKFRLAMPVIHKCHALMAFMNYKL